MVDAPNPVSAPGGQAGEPPAVAKDRRAAMAAGSEAVRMTFGNRGLLGVVARIRAARVAEQKLAGEDATSWPGRR